MRACYARQGEAILTGFLLRLGPGGLDERLIASEFGAARRLEPLRGICQGGLLASRRCERNRGVAGQVPAAKGWSLVTNISRWFSGRLPVYRRCSC